MKSWDWWIDNKHTHMAVCKHCVHFYWNTEPRLPLSLEQLNNPYNANNIFCPIWQDERPQRKKKNNVDSEVKRDLLYNTCVLSVCIHSELVSCHLYETSLWAVGPPGWDIMEDWTATLHWFIWPLVEISPAKWLFDGFTVSPPHPLFPRGVRLRKLYCPSFTSVLSKDTNTIPVCIR